MAKSENKSSGPGAEFLNLDQFIPYWFNQVTNNLNLAMAEHLRPLDVSVARWRVLAILKSFGKMSIGQIAKHAAIRQSTLSRVVDQLERQELVRREPLAENKRIVEVELTPDGEEMYRRFYPAAVSLHTLMADALTDEERQSLFTIFGKLMARLNQGRL